MPPGITERRVSLPAGGLAPAVKGKVLGPVGVWFHAVAYCYRGEGGDWGGGSEERGYAGMGDGVGGRAGGEG